ncbi:MAG: sigma subunit sigma24 -like protein [uncultured Corynebacteriales bacterium]|jgi:RNA polymerase sigma-70 factor (ECF subfamily)|uniref:Sigma subunit sigma24 -like protein n=1 Tax=uncultured Mycobacteriales bacterium TaxID=581187 RepID=A0A6J4JRF8_9ACTN|nr:MAG: sigma subunit sigma24 -like protein [uncultured Corynebacteriales bacterium]
MTEIGTAPDSEELARRAAAGDAAALEELLRAIQPRVHRHVSRFLPYRQDAEEATQDVLLKVATKIHTFQGRSRFSTWLHEVTANQARQTYRTLRRRAAERTTDVPVERPDPRTTSVIAGSRLDLLDALERLETEHPDLVRAFVLRDLSDLEYADIATLLGVPLGTVKARIHHARRHVRQTLDGVS